LPPLEKSSAHADESVIHTARGESAVYELMECHVLPRLYRETPRTLLRTLADSPLHAVHRATYAAACVDGL